MGRKVEKRGHQFTGDVQEGKPGGASFRPDTATERGPMTCPTCHGGGRVSRPQAEADRGGAFDGDALVTCGECGGLGTVATR